MKQEDKELLLQDLCSRLPYGVKVLYKHSVFDIDYISSMYEEVHLDIVDNYTIGISEVKPYLFPMSSMTEEQTEEIHNLIYQGVSESVDETKEWLKIRKENDLRPITLTYILSYKLVIDWFCKNHFDYRDLIPKGLAIDCTNLNVY